MALKYVEHQTPELCMVVVIKDGCDLDYVRDYDLVIELVLKFNIDRE